MDEALFIQAVAQALGADFRVVARAYEQVIRTHELLELGEHWVGFNQAFLRFGSERTAGQALHSDDGLYCRKNSWRNGAGLRRGGELNAGFIFVTGLV
ncbi:hypothetical protein HG619_18515 [Pseudomonas syringae]|nr:hypothetical protein [Pseudomonas syringae]